MHDYDKQCKLVPNWYYINRVTVSLRHNINTSAVRD